MDIEVDEDTEAAMAQDFEHNEAMSDEQVLTQLEMGPLVHKQAAEHIINSFSSRLLIKKLQEDVRGFLEKGKIYSAYGTDLIKWTLYFFFAREDGLCYQGLSEKKVPVGKIRLMEWSVLTKIEVLQDTGIYIETCGLKRLYLRLDEMVLGETREVSAWKWAISLSQLAQLHGVQLCGHVANAAYGFRSLHDLRCEEHAQVLVGRSSSETSSPVKPKQATRASEFVQSRLSSHVPKAGGWPYEDQESTDAMELEPVPPLAPTGVLEDGVTLEPVPELGRAGMVDESFVESDEDEDDKGRRRQWIEFYVGMGQFEEALDLGWDLTTPLDPREELVGLGLTDDHLSAASTSASSEGPSPKTEKSLSFDQRAFSFLGRRRGAKHTAEYAATTELPSSSADATNSPSKPRPRWQGFLSFGKSGRSPKKPRVLPRGKPPVPGKKEAASEEPPFFEVIPQEAPSSGSDGAIPDLPEAPSTPPRRKIAKVIVRA